jgi:hypothetical protein
VNQHEKDSKLIKQVGQEIQAKERQNYFLHSTAAKKRQDRIRPAAKN